MESARPAVIADVPALAVLAAEAVAELTPTRGGSIWSRREGRALPAAVGLAAAIDDPEMLVVAGCVDEAIVGYAVVRTDELRDGAPLAVVDDLYTAPSARGIGIGEAMMDLLVAWAVERGCVGIDALALPGNRATKNFFETFGLVARAIVVHRSLVDDEPSGE